MLRRSSFVLVFLLIARVALAQQSGLPPVDTAVVVLQLSDGTAVTGQVVATSDSSCTVATAAGLRIVVPRRALTSWRVVAAAPVVLGRFGRRDPARSRLFMAPTARTLPRGEGYVGDYYVLFGVVGYGITDHIMLSGGMSLIPGLALDQQLLYLAPKINLVQTPTFNLAAGALYMRLDWSDLVNAWGGVGYAAATFGSEDGAFTLGLGWPFASGGTTRSPWVMAGGEQRVSRGLKLLVEGWKFPGSNEVPVVGGVRFIDEKVAVDLGLVQVVGADFHGVVPWVDFSVRW